MTSPDGTQGVPGKSDEAPRRTYLYARLPAGFRDIFPPLTGLALI